MGCAEEKGRAVAVVGVYFWWGHVWVRGIGVLIDGLGG